MLVSISRHSCLVATPGSLDGEYCFVVLFATIDESSNVELDWGRETVKRSEKGNLWFGMRVSRQHKDFPCKILLEYGCGYAEKWSQGGSKCVVGTHSCSSETYATQTGSGRE